MSRRRKLRSPRKKSRSKRRRKSSSRLKRVRRYRAIRNSPTEIIVPVNETGKRHLERMNLERIAHGHYKLTQEVVQGLIDNSLDRNPEMLTFLRTLTGTELRDGIQLITTGIDYQSVNGSLYDARLILKYRVQEPRQTNQGVPRLKTDEGEEKRPLNLSQDPQ